MDGSPSRLSKRHFFHRFTALVSVNNDRRALVEEHVKNGQVTYVSLKRAAQAFGEAKEVLQSSFVVSKYGEWIKKPLEQDSFEIPFQLCPAIESPVADDGRSASPAHSISPLGF